MKPSEEELEEFAESIAMPKAFVRLMIEAGFHLGENYGDWIIEHYEDVRKLAGFAPLPPVDGITDETARARILIHNVLLTTGEFMASRSTSPELKKAFADITREMEARLDGPED